MQKRKKKPAPKKKKTAGKRQTKPNDLLAEIHDYRTVFDLAPLLIWFKDDKNNILRVNRLAAQSMNLTPEEVCGRSTAELYPEDAEAYYADDMEVIRSGKPKVGIIEKYESRDGRMWVQSDKIPWRDKQGNIKGVVVIVRDITDRMRFQEELQKARDELEIRVEQRTQELSQIHEQLRQSQKMEAIGTLAGGIAHDFNNMLAGILGNADLIKLFCGKDSEIFQAAADIESAARRSARLTQQLMGFARRGKNQNIMIDLRSVVSDMVQLLRRTVDRRIDITERFQEESAWVQGDPDQIQQVVLNLVVNARDAMPDGGRIVLEILRSVVAGVGGGSDGWGHDVKAGEYVRLVVEDTGCGIPLETQSRIFEPFFTTKDVGKGTGMGLAMVYGIVKNHDGAIRVHSQPTQGARFEILLPMASEHGVVKPIFTAEKKLIRGRGVVLVIDDESIVLQMIARLLSQLGYEPKTFAQGREAVEYYQQHFRDISAVIIDMMMPGMDGRSCFLEMKNINPEIKAVLSTGYTLNTAAQAALNEGMKAFLPKPYQIYEISQVMAQVLAA